MDLLDTVESRFIPHREENVGNVFKVHFIIDISKLKCVFTGLQYMCIIPQLCTITNYSQSLYDSDMIGMHFTL